MSITLPPLPDDFKFKGPRKITAQELRARDIEVAKCVLDAAAKACGHLAQADAVAAIIRALEVSHAD